MPTELAQQSRMSLGGAQQGSASHGDANSVGAAKLLTPSPVTQSNSHAKRIEGLSAHPHCCGAILR